MNTLFARQLRRRLGVERPEDLPELLRALADCVLQVCPGSPQAELARRLPAFLETVEQTYAQSERDQELRNRSMAISSAELSQANQRLREASAGQQALIEAMRAAADRMLLAAGKHELSPGETSLESLSSTVLELVQDREETRRKLIESESRFRALTEISSDWYWEQDEQFRYLYVSEGIESLRTGARAFSGLCRWETPGAVFEPSALARHRADLLAHRSFRDFEYSLRGDDGEIRWISTSGEPLFGADARLIGYRGTGKDVTERKRSEAQIAENLRLIEALLESIPDAIAIRDRNSLTTRTNAAFRKLFGIDAGELLGDDNLPPMLSTPEQVTAELSLLKSGGIHRCQVQQDNGQDGARIFLAQRAAFAAQDGSIEGIVISLTDITELENTRRQALSAQRTAEHAMKVRAQFLANMSHEVRTPMNGVLGIASLLHDSGLNDSQRELVGLLQTSGRALLTILNDILDFSKIEAGKVRLEAAAFELAAAVREQLALFAATAREQRLSLTLVIDDRLPARVVGDPTRIGQVLSNLIGNALKFTQQGGVELRVRPVDEQRIRFEVNDTGVGIDPAVQSKIFDAFSQADDSTTRRFGGTGLGLAICRELVGLMGGEIGLDSAPGQGSRFWFTASLPAAAEAQTAEAPAGRPAAAVESSEPARTPAATGEAGSARGPASPTTAQDTSPAGTARALPGRRILLAEDNEVNQRVAGTMLKSLGCVVTIAPNGDAAIQAALSQPFDLILMDCHMPGTDGFGATAALRADEATNAGPRRIIIAQTALAMQGDRELCLTAGMDDYLTKPFTRADLRAMLERWLGDRGVEPARSAHETAADQPR